MINTETKTRIKFFLTEKLCSYALTKEKKLVGLPCFIFCSHVLHKKILTKHITLKDFASFALFIFCFYFFGQLRLALLSLYTVVGTSHHTLHRHVRQVFLISVLPEHLRIYLASLLHSVDCRCGVNWPFSDKTLFISTLTALIENEGLYFVHHIVCILRAW